MELPHYVHVAGAPRARGLAYGETLREVIRRRDEAWKHHLGVVSGADPSAFIAAHLANSDYLTAARHWTPELIEEVDGIAAGAGLSFDHVFAAQLMDEEWLFHAAFHGLAHCTSLGTSVPGLALAAQTMDLPQWMDGFQTILDTTDEWGHRAVVLTAAGMVGLCGLNNAGVGLAVNTLSELPSSTSGLPVAFVARGVLACRSVLEAVQFLHKIRHAAGQNYVIAGADGVFDFECSAEGVHEFRPAKARTGHVWHTNHPLAGGHIAHTQELEATGGRVNSTARMAAADARLGALGGAPDIDTVKALLASQDDAAYPISRPRHAATDHGFTYAAVIWQVAPVAQAHVAAGPPHDTAYRTFGFTD